jgi:hypothetical protein
VPWSAIRHQVLACDVVQLYITPRFSLPQEKVPVETGAAHVDVLRPLMTQRVVRPCCHSTCSLVFALNAISFSVLRILSRSSAPLT